MINVPKHIFKAYDIRGLIDSEVTPELAYQIGRAFVTLRGRELPDRQLRIVVGEDMRPSSPGLAKELMRGLVDGGANVVHVGLVSTPAFYFSINFAGADGGVMVSASHNPAAFNGFKLVRDSAIPVSGDTGIMELAQIIESENYDLGERVGTIEELSGVPARAALAEIEFVGVAPIKKFKIVADSANGMGAQYLDELFKATDLEVTKMFWDLDGTFPNHEADPFKEENCEAIKNKVIELGADLGITTDGDGDRIFFVDGHGEVVEPAILRGVLARVNLRRHPGAKICYDIRPGKITEDLIREAGGVPVVTRVGHSLIKEKMRESGAVFAGESSGHFFYQFANGYFEGPVAVTLQFLQELTASGQSCSDFVKPFRRYVHSGEINFKVADKEKMIALIKDKFNEGELLELDGISITYPNFWFNVRPSNTESLLRLNLEAVDRATMEAKRDEIIALLSEK